MAMTKVLVANRGEIACRVLRTARTLGYRTVAVFSEADRDAPHVSMAYEAVCVGGAAARESYLDGERIIAAAKQVGADAVHPGYGFLSENAGFVRACEAAGLVFIGPPPDAVELMGNKRAAKVAMDAAGVPTVPGYSGGAQDDATLLAEARAVGFPLMVKAAAGGGGRGMRFVQEGDNLEEALRSARAESESAFGSGELILERAVTRPRHVEVQVFGDRHGNVIHLGERDCSVQRRHQKVIEESPSPAVDKALREKMGAAAVLAARAVRYVGAGTVEFLLDEAGAFYFLEMNTRLQVEHPVTELVTGLDLVEWQLRVADGEPLPLPQEAITLSGHAVEARLYAEDPRKGFVPQTGRLLVFDAPDGAGIRVDSGVRPGSVVTPHYDPMLAKVIAHAPTRVEACRRLSAALRALRVAGVVTNKSFLAAICEHPAFVAGEATTAFLTEPFAGHASMTESPPDPVETALAALAAFTRGGATFVATDLLGWRSGGPVWTTVVLATGGVEQSVRVTVEGRGALGRRVAVTWNDDSDEPRRIEMDLIEIDDAGLSVAIDGARRRVDVVWDGDRVWLDDGRSASVFDDVTHRPAERAGGAGSGQVKAPLDGALTSLFVSEGDAVERGQRLLVLEAMKMEHPIKADVDGSVRKIHVSVGTQVKTRQLLVELTPREET